MDKTMGDKLIYISKYDKQIIWKVWTLLFLLPFENLIKGPKYFKATNNQRAHASLGTGKSKRILEKLRIEKLSY